MTAPPYLKMYRRILAKNGSIHLKTDDDGLFQSTLKSIEDVGMEVVKRLDDLHLAGAEDEILLIKTHYEKKFLESDCIIKYLHFR